MTFPHHTTVRAQKTFADKSTQTDPGILNQHGDATVPPARTPPPPGLAWAAERALTIVVDTEFRAHGAGPTFEELQRDVKKTWGSAVTAAESFNPSRAVQPMICWDARLGCLMCFAPPMTVFAAPDIDTAAVLFGRRGVKSLQQRFDDMDKKAGPLWDPDHVARMSGAPAAPLNRIAIYPGTQAGRLNLLLPDGTRLHARNLEEAITRLNGLGVPTFTQRNEWRAQHPDFFEQVDEHWNGRVTFREGRPFGCEPWAPTIQPAYPAGGFVVYAGSSMQQVSDLHAATAFFSSHGVQSREEESLAVKQLFERTHGPGSPQISYSAH